MASHRLHPQKPNPHVKTIYATTVVVNLAAKCQVKAVTTSENATLDVLKLALVFQVLWLVVS